MAGTYPITCGTCGLGVAADILQVKGGTLWLICPHCDEGSVRTSSGVVYPTAPAGGTIKNLPPDIQQAWQEARTTYAVAAYTACEMMCRKILMHVAVDIAGAAPGKHYVEYVNELEAKNYLNTGLKPTIDKIRARGNVANHELPASTEEEARITMAIAEYLLRGVYEVPNL